MRYPLECVPNGDITAALLVDREITFEHAPGRAEEVDAFQHVGFPRFGKLT